MFHAERRRYFLELLLGITRVGLGIFWFRAGWTKFAAFDATGFIQGAIEKGGNSFISNGYMSFLKSVALPHADIINILVPWGEILVGLALIAGALTLPALIAGMFMNINFWLAGTVYPNPLYLFAELLLLYNIKQTVFFGIDRYLFSLNEIRLWKRPKNTHEIKAQ